MYHLKINIIIHSKQKFAGHYFWVRFLWYFDNSSVRNPLSFYGFVGPYSSAPLVPIVHVLNDWNFKANRNENVTMGLKGSWELNLHTSMNNNCMLTNLLIKIYLIQNYTEKIHIPISCAVIMFSCFISRICS